MKATKLIENGKAIGYTFMGVKIFDTRGTHVWNWTYVIDGKRHGSFTLKSAKNHIRFS